MYRTRRGARLRGAGSPSRDDNGRPDSGRSNDGRRSGRPGRERRSGGDLPEKIISLLVEGGAPMALEDLFQAEQGGRILVPTPDGDGADVLAWLAGLPG